MEESLDKLHKLYPEHMIRKVIDLILKLDNPNQSIGRLVGYNIRLKNSIYTTIDQLVKYISKFYIPEYNIISENEDRCDYLTSRYPLLFDQLVMTGFKSICPEGGGRFIQPIRLFVISNRSKFNSLISQYLISDVAEIVVNYL